MKDVKPANMVSAMHGSFSQAARIGWPELKPFVHPARFLAAKNSLKRGESGPPVNEIIEKEQKLDRDKLDMKPPAHKTSSSGCDTTIRILRMTVGVEGNTEKRSICKHQRIEVD